MMRKRLTKTLPALLLVVAAAAGAQTAYRWVGKDGKVNYSDAPPPAEAQQVEPKRLDASVVGTGGKYSYEARQAASDFPVTLYLAPECGAACRGARAYLATRGIPYAEKAVATADDVNAFRQATNSDTLPTLLVGAKAAKGFEATAWGDLLDAAGYPAAR
ncbi:MAG: DUF4124 domain-containing protein [Rhodocyclaceae bacterium]|nr:DUF4124 domain-containing protein [Rhodocyclaceae bacterium]